MPTITFGMIVKNEERFLPACLESIKDLADEIIVVDTGSTDSTVKIAESFGAKIIHHKWALNMAKARDEYIKAATKEWILSLDADERIAKQDIPKIKPLLQANPDMMGFFFLKRDYGFKGTRRPADDPYEESKPFKEWMGVREIRLFKNDKRLHYTHHVHTNIIPAIQKLKGRVADVEGIPLHHFRAQLTPEQQARKRQLYLQMLELEVLENPTDPSAYGHLAAEYGSQEIEKSIKNYEKALALIKKNQERGIKPWTYHYAIVGELGRIYLERGRQEDARACLQLSVDIGSKDPTHHAMLGEIEMGLGAFERAYELFKSAQRMGHPNAPYINMRLNALAQRLGRHEYHF